MGVLGQSGLVLLCIWPVYLQQINGKLRSERVPVITQCPSAGTLYLFKDLNSIYDTIVYVHIFTINLKSINSLGFPSCECNINHCDGEPCDCGK